MNNNVSQTKSIFAIATDPVYIGTGGYTIGRVDNTIVRDPITKIPKIPGSSIAGTWRYYVALELISSIKEYQPKFKDIKDMQEKTLAEKLKKYNWKNLNNNIDAKNKFDKLNNWLKFEGNQIAKITCAGQDETPNEIDSEQNTGHCGHCIVCKAFGYSKAKKDKSWQGMLFFSDLNILFFPVYTRLGTKWITSERILKEAGLINNSGNKEGEGKEEKEIVFAQEKIEEGKEAGFINLGWLNLPYEVKDFPIDLSKVKTDNFELKPEDIIIVPDSLVSQIINSNLEVRTSVSINPITGAAKEKALFTSEAIPRGTVFYGEIRLFNRPQIENNKLPSIDDIRQALEDSSHYYETLGIGGMTTRGFGRMHMLLKDENETKQANEQEDTKTGGNNGN